MRGCWTRIGRLWFETTDIEIVFNIEAARARLAIKMNGSSVTNKKSGRSTPAATTHNPVVVRSPPLSNRWMNGRVDRRRRWRMDRRVDWRLRIVRMCRHCRFLTSTESTICSRANNNPV